MNDATEQMWEAIRTGHASGVRSAISDGADIGVIRDPWEPMTALAFASVSPNALEIIAILLEAGANPRHRPESGYGTLHWCVSEGDPEVVRTLLEAGADPDDDNNAYSESPLHEAAMYGDVATVRLLIDRCKSETLRAESDTYGLPIQHGLYNQKYAKEVVIALLGAGADVNQPTESGETALMDAARCGTPDGVQFLLSLGADPNPVDGFGRSALDHANFRIDKHGVLPDHIELQAKQEIAAILEQAMKG